MSRGETSCPKSQGAKRPGPKRLSAKTFSEPSLHDCETSSMSVTLDEVSLWLWVSFIIIIWFMTRWLVWLNSGKYDTVDQKLSFGNDIWTTMNFNYKLSSPWPWPSGHGWGEDGTDKNFWTHTYHHIWIRSIHGFGNNEVLYNKAPKSVTHDVTRGRTGSSYSSI